MAPGDGPVRQFLRPRGVPGHRRGSDGVRAADGFAAIEGLGEHFGWVDRDNDDVASRDEWQFILDLIDSSAYGIMVVSLSNDGGAQAAEIAWTNRQSIPYIASPLVYDGVVYLVRDGGIVQSLDLATGEVFKRGRTSSSAGSVYASPVAGDGKVFIATLEGEVAVLRAGREWDVLAVNDLDEPIYASPALAGHNIFVRTPTRLYCFGLQD